jgi:hypothetical protein
MLVLGSGSAPVAEAAAKVCDVLSCAVLLIRQKVVDAY